MITRDYTNDAYYINNYISLRKNEYIMYATEGWYMPSTGIYVYRALVVTNFGSVYYSNNQAQMANITCSFDMFLLNLVTTPPQHYMNNIILKQSVIAIIQNLPKETTICIKSYKDIISFNDILRLRNIIASIIRTCINKPTSTKKKPFNQELITERSKRITLFNSIPIEHRCYRCYNYSDNENYYEQCAHGNICPECFDKYSDCIQCL